MTELHHFAVEKVEARTRVGHMTVLVEIASEGVTREVALEVLVHGLGLKKMMVM